MGAFSKCIENSDQTKADIARVLRRDPAQITRWLGGPTNWTLDTISLLLLACGAEMDYYPVFLSERPRRNDQHDLVYDVEGISNSGTIVLRQHREVYSSRQTRTVEPSKDKECQRNVQPHDDVSSKVKILNCIFCDDIRTEVTGKELLIGVYTGDLSVPKNSSPAQYFGMAPAFGSPQGGSYCLRLLNTLGTVFRKLASRWCRSRLSWRVILLR